MMEVRDTEVHDRVRGVVGRCSGFRSCIWHFARRINMEMARLVRYVWVYVKATLNGKGSLGVSRAFRMEMRDKAGWSKQAIAGAILIASILSACAGKETKSRKRRISVRFEMFSPLFNDEVDRRQEINRPSPVNMSCRNCTSSRPTTRGSRSPVNISQTTGKPSSFAGWPNPYARHSDR
ncbi:uncharacterized protein B0T15DRAFT_72801 [Chaetomium strumarium]|uniref:Uncharacterized protein n=1 Tax=Chaetomium strumarium TaxID=1170767 RepID=A0AAJ0H405_9PEZI|nr:hypothetical protein B0T15DRAFT_72801 [Chaetomium strumarium]